jgi:hypothetical protein
MAELLARLEKESRSVSSPLASARKDRQWNPPSPGDECASGNIAYAVGEAALVDEPPAKIVGREAAAAGEEVKTWKAAELPSAPATAPATDAGL